MAADDILTQLCRASQGESGHGGGYCGVHTLATQVSYFRVRETEQNDISGMLSEAR